MHISLSPQQRSQAVSAAVNALATSSGRGERGAVFTKAGVVDALLDLCGYTPDLPLEKYRVLEPSFGNGEFLVAILHRLIQSFKRSGAPWDQAVSALSEALRGVEIHRPSFEETARRAAQTLMDAGSDRDTAELLVQRWLINDDFLLTELDGRFDVVVGNPPYVRRERIPGPLLKEYKRRYVTLYDRADLYVPFYERGLSLLREGAFLGFICSNRWIKNKYGGPLRQKIAEGYSLNYYIDLERAEAFQSGVIAYPAITVLQRSSARRTLVVSAHRDTTVGLSDAVTRLAATAKSSGPPVDSRIAEVTDVAHGRDPWLLDAPEIVAILRALERRLPTLEETNAKVGIGVATGADRVFIGDYEELPVEHTRKLRLAMAADCACGEVSWGGRGVVNPYLASGELAPLAEFPLFATYVRRHRALLEGRYTARKSPDKWYRTIDRIYAQLTHQPKLLIPDIRGEATICYDPGQTYPHHNLYVITSSVWNLRALQAILRSSAALLFVAAYGVRMAGGFLRFQAQYLRRIRCPHWDHLGVPARQALIAVASEPDQDIVDSVVMPLYGLMGSDAEAVCHYASEARVSGREARATQPRGA